MIEVNYLAILLCGVASMVLGSFWYSRSLFGNTYMKAVGGAENISPEKMAEIQKKMWQLYLSQFILALFQAFVLWFYIVPVVGIMSPLSSAIWIWAGFVMPTLAQSWMWSNRPRRLAWKGFFITAGYNIVLFAVFSVIIGAFI